MHASPSKRAKTRKRSRSGYSTTVQSIDLDDTQIKDAPGRVSGVGHKAHGDLGLPLNPLFGQGVLHGHEVVLVPLSYGVLSDQPFSDPHADRS